MSDVRTSSPRSYAAPSAPHEAPTCPLANLLVGPDGGDVVAEEVRSEGRRIIFRTADALCVLDPWAEGSSSQDGLYGEPQDPLGPALVSYLKSPLVLPKPSDASWADPSGVRLTAGQVARLTEARVCAYMDAVVADCVARREALTLNGPVGVFAVHYVGSSALDLGLRSASRAWPPIDQGALRETDELAEVARHLLAHHVPEGTTPPPGPAEPSPLWWRWL